MEVSRQVSFIALEENLLSKKLANAVESLPTDMKEATEADLRKMLKPGKLLYSLRNSFWKEFERARTKGQMMKNSNIVRNICTEVYFYKSVVTDPQKVAWITSPAQNYQSQVEALADKATDRLDELLSIEIHDEDGRIDVRRGELLLKAIVEATNRAKGQAVTRSENRNATAYMGMQKIIKQDVPSTMIEADRRIAELQKVLDAKN